MFTNTSTTRRRACVDHPLERRQARSDSRGAASRARRPGLSHVARPLAAVAATLAVLGVANVASASAAVPGLQRVVASSATNSEWAKKAVAVCPPGKKLVGAGAELYGAQGQAIIDDITPSADLSHLTVTGIEDGDGTTRNWSVSSYATCADPLPGLQRVGSWSGTGHPSATASCPTDKQLIGIGGEISGGNGGVVMEHIRDSWPLRGTTVFAARAGGGPFPDTASVYAWAICAYPLPGLEIVSATAKAVYGVADSRLTCPNGKKVLGAGALQPGWDTDVSRVVGRVVIDDIVATSDLTGLRVVAYAGQTAPDTQWWVEGRAICATA